MENWVKQLAEQYVQRMLNEMPAREVTGPPSVIEPHEADIAAAKMSPEERRRAIERGKFHTQNRKNRLGMDRTVRQNIVKLGKAARRAEKSQNAPSTPEVPLTPSHPTSIISGPVTVVTDPETGKQETLSVERQEELLRKNAKRVKAFERAAKEAISQGFGKEGTGKVKLLTREEKARIEQAQKNRASNRTNENWVKEIKNSYFEMVHSLTEENKKTVPFWKHFPGLMNLEAPKGSDLEDPNAPPPVSDDERIHHTLKKMEPLFRMELPRDGDGEYQSYDHGNPEHRKIVADWWKERLHHHEIPHVPIHGAFGALNFERTANELMRLEDEEGERIASDADKD